MRGYRCAGVVLCVLALACGGRNQVKAAPGVGLSSPVTTGGESESRFADAVKIEGWLAAARIPFTPRPELVVATFPAGCVWHAVYATANPEVILEVYSFTDVEKAENYVTNRRADYSVMDIAQPHEIVNNGPAVLVVRYNETGDDDDKASRMAAFAAAFVAGK